MKTVFVENPLLNSPHLIGLILRGAAKGKGSLEACLSRLGEVFTQSREDTPLDMDEARTRFERLIRHLEKAKLIEGDASHFTITERGRNALTESPNGFATADLMAYPEYAIFVRNEARSHATSDPHASAFDLGSDAFRKGMSRSDNPYNPDSADHLAWQNGWSSALSLNH
ncbi:ribosome modulation factor [Amaricoccus macauensis]|uniref:ribosome modulation factor n=1 Tax=Amaricoccus macauensis TaxID=57001 RepID=UPI003C7B69D4